MHGCIASGDSSSKERFAERKTLLIANRHLCRAYVFDRSFSIPAGLFQASHLSQELQDSSFVANLCSLLSVPGCLELLEHEGFQGCFLTKTVVVDYDILHASSRCTLMSFR